MKNDFDKTIKNIENEILALKTATEYTSIRSASYSTSSMVNTGLYQITYSNTSEPVFSLIYGGQNVNEWNLAYARTPSGNTQVVEIFGSSHIAIVSNKPVISITKIS